MQRLDGRDVFSISELNKFTNDLLQSLPPMWIVGEISKISSKDFYCNFDLKDADAVLSCYVPGSTLKMNTVKLETGKKIILKGSLSLFERGGKFSIKVLEIEEYGDGDLQRAFEQLKNELQAKGYFNQEHKKIIPNFPKKIGVVSSRDGDALQDIRRIISHRFPTVKLYLIHTHVQGIYAVKGIIKGIQAFNKLNNVDVIIVTRGGGSIEDLAAYNTKEVALAIFESKIPVVSAVGHEKDITIADLVADKRASTPSNAAEIVVPNKDDIEEILNNKLNIIKNSLLNYNLRRKEKLGFVIKDLKDKLKNKKNLLENSFEYKVLVKLINFQNNFLATKLLKEENLRHRLKSNIDKYLEKIRCDLKLYSEKSELLNPYAILGRGYSIAYNENYEVIKNKEQIKDNEVIILQLHKDKVKLRKS